MVFAVPDMYRVQAELLRFFQVRVVHIADRDSVHYRAFLLPAEPSSLLSRETATAVCGVDNINKNPHSSRTCRYYRSSTYIPPTVFFVYLYRQHECGKKKQHHTQYQCQCFVIFNEYVKNIHCVSGDIYPDFHVMQRRSFLF